MSAILSEGKTKIIRRGERPGEVVLETKDELTAGDAAKLDTIRGIAAWKTTQARNVFRLLQSEGIDTAYLRPAGDRAMVCSECKMLPLELVTRRYALGEANELMGIEIAERRRAEEERLRAETHLGYPVHHLPAERGPRATVRRIAPVSRSTETRTVAGRVSVNRT